MRDDKEKLEKILECIDRVTEYTKGGQGEFFNSSLIQDGVVRNLQVIGEAVKELSEPLKNTNPEVPWHQVSRMRDKVTHDYFEVDYQIVWKTVEQSLPPFRVSVEDIHQRLVYKVPEKRDRPNLEEKLKENP